ncbi:hypothetical protein QR98_0068770 [Sarcoptes scabiei]|uniref:Uncharacterized protein n=1 Tax=Sarcoptes scabiei TaxID=52283 RepID=A0A132ABJ6_SARSC|nr:hypothetical protein QR98_0068770 [Sarcoptes scabiei]
MKEGNFGNFHQRLISRRKIKSIASTSSTSSRYPDDDDKTDNSLDSATMKAHEEILRNANLLKQERKNSIDDDVFGITATKARRSPLRILGNLVDDKIFRGRWSTAKRAKSTDEITWALAQEEKNLLQQNNGPNRPRSVNSKQARKKSLGGFLSAPSTDMNNNFFSIKKTPSKNKLEKFKNNSDSNSEISINQSVYPVNKTTKFKFMEITRRKPSNSSYTETFNVSDSSINSVTERKPIRRKIISNVWPSSAPSDRHQDSSTSITMKNTSKNLNQGIIQRNEIKAETLAEIEVAFKLFLFYWF